MKSINKELFNYLYDRLGASYKRSYKDVESNLNNTKEENLEYLGTYFPRSYAEAYYIYTNIFNDTSIYEKFNKRNKIKILDIGSGTGGSLMGLLQALNEKFSLKEFEIISIEGNASAVEIQLTLLNSFKNFISSNGNRFKGNVHIIEFKNKSELSERLSLLAINNNIDIMHSFKFVNEFYRGKYSVNKGMYKELLMLGNEWLRNSGILCLVDVTDKIDNLDFISILFNEEVKDYLHNERTDLSYILPKCCAIHYDECKNKNNCYSKRSFIIDFDNNPVESKINYKLFIKGNLGEEIRSMIINNWCNFNNCYCIGERRENCTKLYDTPYIL